MAKVNGTEKALGQITVAQLLEAEGYDPVKVAVEINLDIVPKAQYAKRLVADSDTVEIVSFVGGG
ncbi:MAG: sulfur carrier protein ThiS [Ruminococcus sp.]|nr:sulfur carrier protein ThiS [Ruminococcus sp.]